MIKLCKLLRKDRLSLSKITKLLRRSSSSRSILDLSERGFWNDRFPSSNLEFEKDLSSESLTAYAGFDPTADSLHIGNLLVLNALLHFQRSGHNVIALIGGATGLVGDPSGKSKERPLLEESQIEANIKSITNDIQKIFENHEKFIWKAKSEKDNLKPLKILNNIEWYQRTNFIHFLRDVGKHMRMGSLLKRSTIETRLQSNAPLSYTEFSYQIMQGYDWLYLYKNHDCTVQVGGSDQMGNIMTGHNLISRVEDIQVTGLTVPLITSEAGDKLGKSSGSPVWLSPAKTSSYEFYQFFLRTKDSDVENLLKLLTFIPLSEIRTVMDLHKEDSSAQRPQKKLAEHLTLLVFGEVGLSKAKRATELLFGSNSTVLTDMTSNELQELFKGVPVIQSFLKPGLTVLDLAILAECFPTQERAIDVIKRGGFYVNQGRVTNPFLILIPGIHILPNGVSLIRVGKRNYYIVQWNS